MKMLYIKHRSGKRMNNFAISAILAATELGFDFTIANNMSLAEPGHFEQVCEQYGIKMVDIPFSRNPLSPDNIKAGKQLLALMQKERYDIVHCNTPSGGMVGRICAKLAKVPVIIYQAHGYHFWKGAPLKNWIFYYPIEKLLSYWTNIAITITREDEEMAKKRLHAGLVEYVPGVGIDLTKYALPTADRMEKRESIGIPDNATLLISVGELNENKNQETVIRAIAGMDVYYIIAGIGDNHQHLLDVAAEVGMSERVKLLGFRTDVRDLYACSDVFVIPSFREGLSVSMMEAMASHIPCVAGRIRGNVDLLPDSELLFDPHNIEELKSAIQKGLDSDIAKREVEMNNSTLQKFSMTEAVSAMKRIYEKAAKIVENEMQL